MVFSYSGSAKVMLTLTASIFCSGVTFASSNPPNKATLSCPSDGAWLQVLGSGGPEIDDGRASASYVVWLDGKAKVLVDTGAGSHNNFEKSGANFNDLDVIAFSHLHVDHSNDLPAYIKSSFFTGRSRDLAVLGPEGNRFLPATDVFLQRLFGKEGAWPYLSRHVDPQASSYQLQAKMYSTDNANVGVVFENQDLSISAIGVNHGPLPAVAWRVDFIKSKKSIVFSGDMNGKSHHLEKLALGADLLVAHNAVPEDARGVARNLHMPPSVIGEIANKAKAKQVVLAHRMKRTNDKETATKQEISKLFSGVVKFSDDMQCFKF